jgi:type I restriction-modification system DNA methylase subunit
VNERITEAIVRNKFKPFVNQGFIIEEQQSKNPRIRKLLQFASKHGSGKGYPEFIIQSEEDSDFLLTVECKADIRFHQSKSLDQYSKYAVDGALLYSSYLSKEFDVISLGVSGQNLKELKATSYLQHKTSNSPLHFCDGLLGLDEFKEKYIYDDATKIQRYDELLVYNKELNQTLHNYKIPESNRSLLLSGILIALEHDVFKKGYTYFKTSQQLADNLVVSVVEQLKEADIQNLKVETLKHAYSFIKTNATLTKNKELFINLISDVDRRINSFIKTYKFYDIFGDFYIEFLRYANSDKGLGIVLTPKHITELFCELGNITKDSVIFDNCCGTGGFLISGLRKMLELSGHNKKKEQQIKEKQIIGIEFQDSIFPLACSNMIVHGDGKTNLFNADCFDEKFKTGNKIFEIKDGIKKEIDETVVLTKYICNKFHPSIGLLNPPYKTDKKDVEELEFVLNNLEGLEQNALCIALVPMSCVLAQKGPGFLLKERIMKNHTLEAVMSLPDEIFHNSKVAVVTCAIVIRAHIPHPTSYKSYFGYWKDDGFVKRKIKGRVDGGNWKKIKEKWLLSYKNKDSITGLSIVKIVTASDEWCAEAYMETDYSKLNFVDFEQKIKEYIAFKYLTGIDK